MSTIQEPARPAVVRQFISELKPHSDLAVQARSCQEDMEMEIELKEKIRVDRIYYQEPIESSFTGVEIARQALEAECDKFFKSQMREETEKKKKSKAWRVFHHNNATQQVAQQISKGRLLTVDQITRITNELQEEWRQSSSKTSLTYSNTAEQLSSFVADLSERISICTAWLDLYQKAAMKQRLTEIYEQFFRFFIKVASWYAKPKVNKVLDSLNSNLNESYKAVVNDIQRSIQLLKEQAQIEHAHETSNFRKAMTESTIFFKAELAKIRSQRDVDSDLGWKVCQFLVEQFGSSERAHNLIGTSGIRLNQAALIDSTEATEAHTSEYLCTESHNRAEAEVLCSHLQELVDQVEAGDGIKSAIQAGRLVTEPVIIHALRKWTMASTGEDLILWVISPFEIAPPTSAELVAYGVIWSAVQAKAQFVSYICERPRPGQVPGFQGAEDKAAVLAMAYSLIMQLLQFHTPDDELRVQKEIIDRLTRPGERWSSALALLKCLLENTPTLRYCIISRINLIENNAREMCREFVDMLFLHVRNSNWPLRILFTTSGQSRALLETVGRESKVESNNHIHQRKGHILYGAVQMPG
ncbi:uncharacterized protein N7511_007312 [Penicillium nucicola]|uniref:uncharacterized protein n=1 Tax=Penicillium nucicola TaxID=1850975 RepID=UPI002544E17D|nr:uncharacterized protein N7511_007312 [Penicillium nucicola]KAJ5757130.1 hypothetical protein N7511_007312 [Penicillium nucicola]